MLAEERVTAGAEWARAFGSNGRIQVAIRQ